jgi:hypothetical protein
MAHPARSDDRGDDCAGRAAANQLSGQGAYVQAGVAGMSALLRIEPPPAPHLRSRNRKVVALGRAEAGKARIAIWAKV